MSRKHFKICGNCLHYQKIKGTYKGGFYRYGFFGGFWYGEPACRFNLTPRKNGGNETCVRYQSENSRRNKKWNSTQK